MNVRTAVRPPRPDTFQEQPHHPAPALVAPLPPPERVEASRAYPPKIAKAILAIMRGIGSVEKAGWNDFHKYNYQKWDDILGKVSTMLAEQGLIIIPSEVSRSLVENDQQKNDQLVAITYEFTIINEDGEVWPERPRMTAFGRVRDSRNVCDDKAAAKCHTQAEKYFLIHLFKIRTADAIDSDADAIDSDADGATQSRPAVANGKPKPPRPPGAGPQSPRSIPTDNMTFQKWSSDFIAAIKTAGSMDSLDQWLGLNALALDMTKERAAAIYATIDQAVKERRNDLGARVEKPKPPAPGAPPPKDAMPNPADNINAWWAWLDGKLGTFDDMEKMESYWNDTIAPLVDDLLPPDGEQALGLYRKHEHRLEP